MLPPNSSASKSWIKRNSKKHSLKKKQKHREQFLHESPKKNSHVYYILNVEMLGHVPGDFFTHTHKKKTSKKPLQQSVQRSACRPIPGRIESSNQIPAKRLGGSQAEAVIWMVELTVRPLQIGLINAPKSTWIISTNHQTFRGFFAVSFREGYLAIPTFSLGVRLQEGVFNRRVCYSPET